MEKNRGDLSTFHSSNRLRANSSVFWLESIDGKDSHTITNIFLWLYSAIIFLCLLLSALLLISFPFLLSSLFIFSLFYYLPPPVLMPSCLLVLIFIYRFSSFSLPFLCTDGTLQLASHSASSLTSPQVNAFHILLPFFWYKTSYFWTLQYREARLRQNTCTTPRVKRSW